MPPADGDRDRADPGSVDGPDRVELEDSDGTIIPDEMVEVLTTGRSTGWDVREDERTG